MISIVECPKERRPVHVITKRVDKVLYIGQWETKSRRVRPREEPVTLDFTGDRIPRLCRVVPYSSNAVTSKVSPARARGPMKAAESDAPLV